MSLPGEEAYRAFVEFLASRHGEQLFSLDGSTVDAQVASLLADRMVAVAESCTGGLMSARLTELPGPRRTLPGASSCTRTRPRFLSPTSTRT